MMSPSASTTVLQFLRRRRRLLTATLLCTLAVWIATLYAQCLQPAFASPPSSATSADVGVGVDRFSHPPAHCTATPLHRALSDDAAVPSTGLKLWSVVLFAAALLLTFSIPRKISLPPQPLLPKRPRTLKFYALRI